MAELGLLIVLEARSKARERSGQPRPAPCRCCTPRLASCRSLAPDHALTRPRPFRALAQIQVCALGCGDNCAVAPGDKKAPRARSDAPRSAARGEHAARARRERDPRTHAPDGGGRALPPGPAPPPSALPMAHWMDPCNVRPLPLAALPRTHRLADTSSCLCPPVHQSRCLSLCNSPCTRSAGLMVPHTHAACNLSRAQRWDEW